MPLKVALIGQSMHVRLMFLLFLNLFLLKKKAREKKGPRKNQTDKGRSTACPFGVFKIYKCFLYKSGKQEKKGPRKNKTDKDRSTA